MTTMAEYDFSPEASDYDYIRNNRIHKWVQQTEQHRGAFEAAVPGAPGAPPAIHRSSPSVPEHYPPSHRSLPTYSKLSKYHHAPPSSSASEDTHIPQAPPSIKRHRPSPPPNRAPVISPPVPPHFQPRPLQSQPYILQSPSYPPQSQPRPSPPVPGVGDGRIPPTSSSSRHHRVKSKFHQFPPPSVTPIYASPTTSTSVPPPTITYVPSQVYPISPSTRSIATRNARRPTEPTTTQMIPSTTISMSGLSYVIF